MGRLTIVRHLPSTIAIEIRGGTRWPASCPPAGPSTAEAPAAGRRQRTLNCPEETGTAAGEAWLISVGGRLLEPALGGTGTALTVTGLSRPLPQAGTQMAELPQAEETRRQGLMALLAALEDGGTLEKGVLHRPVCGDGDLLLRYDGRFDVKLPISGDFYSTSCGHWRRWWRSGRAMRPGQWT